MAYVREGLVFPNAIAFRLPVASNNDHLLFLWWNSGGQDSLRYKLHIKISDETVMFQPTLNISHSGLVPFEHTLWKASLICNHRVDGNVKVEFKFEFSDGSRFTTIRDKYCNVSPQDAKKTKTEPEAETVSSELVFLYSFIVATLIAAILGCTVCYVQRRTSPSKSKLKTNNQDLTPNSDNPPLLPPPPTTRTANIPVHNQFRQLPPGPNFGTYDANAGMTSDAESRVTDWIQQQIVKQDVVKLHECNPEEAVKNLEVERQRLKLGSLLQEGTFGRVYQVSQA